MARSHDDFLCIRIVRFAMPADRFFMGALLTLGAATAGLAAWAFLSI
jgi:hypothetical protein